MTNTFVNDLVICNIFTNSVNLYIIMNYHNAINKINGVMGMG